MNSLLHKAFKTFNKALKNSVKQLTKIGSGKKQTNNGDDGDKDNEDGDDGIMA